MIVRKLEYLIALAREGHYARAAASCHVSQPTLSAALRQLEIEMGVTIVKRGQRYSGLTEQGERVLAFAHRMSIECEHLRRELENRGGESLGTIQLGVIPSAIPSVSTLTVAFHKQHPLVNVKIIGLNPADIQRSFEEFALDIAITYLTGKVLRQGRCCTLYEEEYSLLVRRGGYLSGEKTVSWTEAAKLPLCLLAPEMQCPGSPVIDLLSHPGANSAHIETNSITALYSQVRSGDWAAVIPRSLALEADVNSELESIPLAHSGQSIPVGVMIPDRDLTFPLAEAFFNVAAATKNPAVRRKKSEAFVNR